MKIHEKTKFRKRAYLVLTVLVVVLAVIIIVFALLFHRPVYYKPLHFPGSREVSLYLTNELLPALYNGAQLQEPFDLVITQNGINDVVAHSKWPQEFGSVKISAPMVFFSPGSIVLMAAVVMEGAELIATIVAEPAIDAEGLLSLQVVSVQFGAVDVTPFAKALARRICQHQFAEAGIGADDVRARVAASLLDSVPFEPVFEVEDKKVRIDKITVESKKLTIHFVPVLD